MALIDLQRSGLVVLGNRNDSCYLCTEALKKTSKKKEQFDAEARALRGLLECKPVVKIKRAGTDTVICLECIHKIANENPIQD
jgi:hypothetical protein